MLCPIVNTLLIRLNLQFHTGKWSCICVASSTWGWFRWWFRKGGCSGEVGKCRRSSRRGIISREALSRPCINGLRSDLRWWVVLLPGYSEVDWPWLLFSVVEHIVESLDTTLFCLCCFTFWATFAAGDMPPFMCVTSNQQMTVGETYRSLNENPC